MKSPVRLFGSLLLALLCCCAASAQNFAQPTVLRTGSWPAFVAAADMNNDGHPDLFYIDGLTASGRSTYHWFLGDGKGGFKLQPAVGGWYGSSMIMGDFLGLGTRQMADAANVGPTTPNSGYVQCSVAEVVVFADDLTSRSRYSTSFCSSGTNPPVIGNVTAAGLRKGKPTSLVFTDSANSLLYVVDLIVTPAGFGNVNVDPMVNAIPLPDGAGPVFAVDINNDGNLDLIVNGQTGLSAQIFLGSAVGIAPAAKPTARFRGPYGTTDIHSMLVQPYRNSALPALIAETANGHLDVFYADGAGSFHGGYSNVTFKPDGRTGNGGHLIALTKRGLDGAAEFLTATPIGISTLLDGDPAFASGIYNAGPGRTSYALADFNGDGTPDLAVDSPEGIAILYGNPDGSFQSSRAFSAGLPALSIAPGSFTSPAQTDVVVSTAATQAQVLLNAGAGLFSAVGGANSPVPTTPQRGTAGLWSTVKVGDFDGDGKTDLVLTADGSQSLIQNNFNSTAIQYSHGDGTFDAPITRIISRNECQMSEFGTSAVGDFKAPGVPGLVNLDSTANEFVYEDFTPVLFARQKVPLTSDCSLHLHDVVVSGDLNGDGVADVVAQNDGHLFVQLDTANNGVGAVFTFARSNDLSLDGGLTTPGQMVAPDLSSTFPGPSVALGFPAFLGSMTIADLDGDGNGDLIVAYDNLGADHTAPTAAAPNYIYIWYGSGGGKFLTSAKHPVNPVRFTPSRNFYQVAVADVNGDGIPDLILGDGYLLSYQLGKGDGTFGAEVHLLAGQGINGIAVADVRGTGHNDLLLANGGLTLSNPVANKETLTPNPDVDTGGITVLLNGTPKATVSSLTVSPEPSVFFSPFILTANVPGPGEVDFAQDGVAIGTATVSNGVATIPAPIKTLPGTHQETAVFRSASSGLALQLSASHTVLRGPSTTIFTPTTPQTVYYGQAVDGTFAIIVADPADYPYTGTYSVLDNGVSVAGCTSIPTAQLCPYGNPQLLDAGPHSFQVAYLGDAVNAPSVSTPYLFTVLPDLTFIALSVSPATAPQGSPVAISGIVTGNFATPSGPGIVFYNSGAQRGVSGPLRNGIGTILLSDLTLGLHCFTAVYPGNQNFNQASQTTPICVTITPAAVASSTTLTSSVNPSSVGQLVTFNATVTPAAAGLVIFYDGASAIGQTPLNAGAIASFSTSTLALGSHPITAAVFTAGGLPVGAPSAVLVQIVNRPAMLPPGDFTLSVTPNPLRLGVGRTGILQVTIAGINGLSAEAVQLSCAPGLPPEATCNFVQAAMPAGGGVTTLQLGTKAPRDCGTEKPYFLGGNGALYGGPALAGLALLFWRRRRRVSAGLLALALTVGLLGLAGCGHCTDLGTRPGDYSFTVVATGTAPVSATHTVTVRLTMTIP